MIISYLMINSLIFSCFVTTFYSQIMNATLSAASSLKFGPVLCHLYGSDGGLCDFESILCDQLPDECNSYFYMEASVDLLYHVQDFVSPENDAYFKRILQCSKIPVITTYGYKSLKDWSIALACCGINGTNVQDEMEGFKAYRNDHPNIAGIALANLDIVPGSPSFKDFTKNLNCYINALKETMPDLEIGLYIQSDYLQKYIKDPKVEWINFKELTNAVTFVVVAFTFYKNKCTPELKNGVFPITGDYEYTLEKSLAVLNKAGVPANMTYFRIEIGPTKENFDTLCNVNVKNMCLNPKIATDYCSDTTATYYEKGVFAKNNGVGFVGAAVDTDDVHCACQCGRLYPSFRAIVDGFNGATRPPPCHLLDRS